MRATHTRDQVLAALQRDHGALIPTAYAGAQVYANAAGDAALAFLERDLFAIGALPDVHALVDVRRGSRPKINGKLRDTFLALDNVPFRIAGQPPQGALLEGFRRLREGNNLSGSAVDLTDVWSAQRYGLGLDSTDGGVSIHQRMEYSGASDTAGAIARARGLISLLRAFSGSAEVTSVLGKTQVAGNGAAMIISLRLEAGELQNIHAVSRLLATGRAAS